jgi:integrative and conjugative element protein (TIGR02256 family)
MIVYPVGSSSQVIVFTDRVLEHFERYQQRRCWHREAGGQLFARFAMPHIIVEEATGPRRGDRRSRYSYQPDRGAEQREIAERHAKGLYFIGDWHTHPEHAPTPSDRDIDSITDSVACSQHALNGFVLVIVGRDAIPAGLNVSVFSSQNGMRLMPAHQPASTI